ncbi:MAG: hypothetical protein ABR608_10880 [Pseudonocardiaceae bacterium]
MRFDMSGFHALPLTCTIDGLAHLVSDDAAAAGVAAGRGTYMALCGHTVHAAALVSSAGRPCARCGLRFDALRAEAGVEASNRRARRRGGGGGRSWRGRLLGHHPSLARPDSARLEAGVTALSTATGGLADWFGRWKIIK